MATEFVHIGFGNILAMDRVVAILSPDQEPTKRMIREAKNNGKLIDATHARKIKAALILDSGHVVIAAVAPETLVSRLAASRGEEKDLQGCGKGDSDFLSSP